MVEKSAVMQPGQMKTIHELEQDVAMAVSTEHRFLNAHRELASLGKTVMEFAQTEPFSADKMLKLGQN